MADYYPLIARAIAGLDPSAPGESRRALYERARAALIAQLRGVQPPLSESEITRERLALEEAVRKVESEAAQRAREASRGSAAAGGSARPRDALRRAGARTSDAGGPAQPGPAPEQGAAPPRPRPASPPRNDRPPLGEQAESLRPRNPRGEAAPQAASPPRPQQAPVGMQDPQLPPARAAVPRAVGTALAMGRARACAASAISPPMSTISARRPPKPTEPRARPTPTYLRQTPISRSRRTSTMTPRHTIPMTNRTRKPNATHQRCCLL